MATNKQNKPKVLGFTLHNKNNRWHACKRIANKLRWVYIGEDPSMAEEKIRSWCTRHGIVIENQTKPVFIDVQQKFGQIEQHLTELKQENLQLKRQQQQLEKEIANLKKQKETATQKEAEFLQRLEIEREQSHKILGEAFLQIKKISEETVKHLQPTTSKKKKNKK